MTNGTPPIPAQVQAMSDEEKRLRKEWLKKKFASFEYHEEMLRLHHQWIEVLRKALARAKQDESPNHPNSGFKTIAEEARHFETRYMPLIERNDDLGKYQKDEWPKYRATATFRSIPDYDRYLLSEGDMLSWMTPDEDQELGKCWGQMSRMAQNIKYTVDDYWFNPRKGNDDMLLNEHYTGPIDWPMNWRDDLQDASPFMNVRIKAGIPVPQGGLWQSIDSANSQRRRIQSGEVLPDLGSSYGTTVWERIGD